MTKCGTNSDGPLNNSSSFGSDLFYYSSVWQQKILEVSLSTGCRETELTLSMWFSIALLYYFLVVIEKKKLLLVTKFLFTFTCISISCMSSEVFEQSIHTLWPNMGFLPILKS